MNRAKLINSRLKHQLDFGEEEAEIGPIVVKETRPGCGAIRGNAHEILSTESRWKSIAGKEESAEIRHCESVAGIWLK